MRLPVDGVLRALLIFLLASLGAGVASKFEPSSALASNLVFAAMVAILTALFLRKETAIADLILAAGMFLAGVFLLLFAMLLLMSNVPSLYDRMSTVFDFVAACMESIGLPMTGGPDAPFILVVPIWIGSVALLLAASCSAGLLLRRAFEALRRGTR